MVDTDYYKDRDGETHSNIKNSQRGRSDIFYTFVVVFFKNLYTLKGYFVI